jgi:hypothetical protein
MDLSPYRSWLLLFHILSVFGFLLLHGVSVVVAFRLRAERDRTKIAAYLELSNWYLNAMYTALTLVLVSGILAGIAGAWWTAGRLWIWASVVVLVLLAIAMPLMGTRWFDALRHAVGLPTFADNRSKTAPPPAASDAELSALLASPRPIQLAVVGLGGLVILAWLMVLKPF